MKRTKIINKYISQLEEMYNAFEEMVEKTQTRYDNMSERAQEGEKGEQLNDDISAMEDIKNSIESLRDELENAYEAE